MSRKPSCDEIAQYVRRIASLEKRVVLPARIAVMAACLALLWPIIAGQVGVKDLAFLLRWSLGGYAILSLLYWFFIFHLAENATSMRLTQGAVFASAMTDNIFLGILLYALMMEPLGPSGFGGAPEASLFGVYCALLVRNVFLFPGPGVQSLINLLYVVGYVSAIFLNMTVYHRMQIPSGAQRELLSRVIVLLLVSICSAAVYALRRRELRELDEAHEKTIRSLRLDIAGMLAGQVAHELKNPLSIMTNAAFLLRRSKATLDPKLSQHLDVIQEEIQRADKIISELLDYARLAEGRIEGVLVNDCLDECVAALKHELEVRRIEVSKEYSLDLPFLFIDPGQLRQIFSNILLNACEATEDGGRVAIATSYSTLGFIAVSISDSGKGIPTDVRSKIFKPFFTTKDKGTGMGLSIVQNVVRAYRGEIDVESEELRGTTFHLRFPTRMASFARKDGSVSRVTQRRSNSMPRKAQA